MNPFYELMCWWQHSPKNYKFYSFFSLVKSKGDSNGTRKKFPRSNGWRWQGLGVALVCTNAQIGGWEIIQTHAINNTFAMFSYVIGNQNLLMGATIKM